MKVYGKNVLYEALRSNHKIYEVYLREDVAKSDASFLNKLNQRKIKVHILDKHQMNQMFDGLHQGYGANIENFKNYALEDVINSEKRQLFLILDKLNDPNNLGAIIRSCDAFSVDAIIIPNKNSIGITETVVKVSTGAIFYTPIVTVSNINQTIDKLKKNNFWVIGTDASANQNISDIKNDRNLALVIGSEGYGISNLVAKNCDFLVKIPMTGHVNSLNASVSAGIMIYALMCQSEE